MVAPPADREQATASEVDAHLRDALARSSVKDAVAEVSEAAGRRAATSTGARWR